MLLPPPSSPTHATQEAAQLDGRTRVCIALSVFLDWLFRPCIELLIKACHELFTVCNNHHHGQIMKGTLFGPLQLEREFTAKRYCGRGSNIFDGLSYQKMDLLCGSHKFFACTLNGLATALANLPTAPWDKVRARPYARGLYQV